MVSILNSKTYHPLLEIKESHRKLTIYDIKIFVRIAPLQYPPL
jgi:hypothetical protein